MGDLSFDRATRDYVHAVVRRIMHCGAMAETARRLGLSLINVKVIAHRARAKLRAAMMEVAG